MKGKRLPYTVLQVIEFPGKLKQKEKIVDLWKHFDVKIVTRPVHGWLGDITEINKIAFSENVRNSEYGVCDQPWRHAVIYWDGRVGPCCNFYDKQVVLGDLHGNDLASIWNSQKAQGFRRNHVMMKRSQIKECKTCKQKAPNYLEKSVLTLFDVATINKYFSSVDGWRDG